MSVIPLDRGWTQDRSDRGTGPSVRGGRISLLGHFICADAQEQMKKDNWPVLMNISSLYAPFGDRELRFPGRVRWYARAADSAVPKTLWWSDVVVAPAGAISLAADLPREVLNAAGSVEVFLDGVSYSDEKIWIV
jgi:hypothetical protein